MARNGNLNGSLAGGFAVLDDNVQPFYFITEEAEVIEALPVAQLVMGVLAFGLMAS